jgi:tight adherence protein C
MWFWLACLAAGISLCSLCWLVVMPWAARGGSAAAAVDFRVPAALRWAWPWVAACAAASRPFIPWNLRTSLATRLLRAGLPASWQAEHFIALQMLAAIVLAAAPILAMFLGAMSVGTAAALVPAAAAGGLCWPAYWLRGRAAARRRIMLKEFPFLLDIGTLCVEAGLNLHGALQQAAAHGPPGPLRDELRHALADMRAGKARSEALQGLALRCGLDAVFGLVAAIAQADQLGMSLAPILRAQADQRRGERFLRAEKLALEAPVKMLFPMVFCIFPCTFLIIGLPIAARLLGLAS